jgi:hypothetical protein
MDGSVWAIDFFAFFGFFIALAAFCKLAAASAFWGQQFASPLVEKSAVFLGVCVIVYRGQRNFHNLERVFVDSLFGGWVGFVGNAY